MHKRFFDRFGKSKAGELLLLGICYAAFYVVCALLFALVAFNMKNPVPYLPLFSFAAFVLSGFLCGIFTAKTKKEDKLKTTLITASFAGVLAILLSFVLGGHIGGNTLLCVACYLITAALGGIIGTSKRKHRRIR